MDTVILTPCALGIDWQTDQELRILESMGYEVWRIPGWSAIDQCRNNAVYNAVYERKFKNVLFIDGDVIFKTQDVQKIISHNLPVVAAAYPFKGFPRMTVQPFKKQEIVFDEIQGSVQEVDCVATGFLFIQSEVFHVMQKKLKLPLCNTSFSAPQIPFFKPDVWKVNKKYYYLGEDFSFCKRARKCDYKIMLDSTIKLGHVGRYRYEWEDVANQVGILPKSSKPLVYKPDKKKKINSSKS